MSSLSSVVPMEKPPASGLLKSIGSTSIPVLMVDETQMWPNLNHH
jgi:hypothetical protein